jgi:hypothetical protein
VAAAPGCTGEYAGVLVALEPLGRTVITASDGTFAFAAVPDGDYTLIVEPGCSPSSYCFEPVAVAVRGSDVSLEVCFSPSLCAPDHIRVEPIRVRPGGSIDVSGRCYYVHSGAGLDVYLDDSAVARLNGSTAGGYETLLAVAPDAALGTHQVRVVAIGNDTEIARASFQVVDALAACTGDCNADGGVSVDELVAGVALALGYRERPACAPAFCSAGCGPGPAYRPPGVDCLIRAVRSAANGCPTDLCVAAGDCDDGNPLTDDRCTAHGCENTCLTAGPSAVAKLRPAP